MNKRFWPLGIVGLIAAAGFAWGTGFGGDTAAAGGDETEAGKIKVPFLYGTKKVTVVSIPYFSFLEWEEEGEASFPHLFRLAEEGRIAALNVRTQGGGLEDSYLTLGAGTQAFGAANIQAVNRDETYKGFAAALWYNFYLGEGNREGKVLVPELEAVRKMNASQRYGAEAGLLGEQLKRSGIKTYVYGNSDAPPGQPAGDSDPALAMRRYAPLMLMDRDGAVYGGDVGPSTLSGARFHRLPGTDYAYLLTRWEQAERPSVVLLELGDLYRIYQEKDRFRPERFSVEKGRILREMDAFVGALAARMEPGDSLWIFSPAVNPDAAEEKMYLAPLIHVRQGIAPGTLVSPTTRRPGIVTNYDMAPTLLAEFSLPQPSSMIGFPVRPSAREGAGPWLMEELKGIAQVYKLRPHVLYPFVIYEIAVLLLGLVVVLKRWQARFPFVPFLLYTLLAAPLVLLVLGGMKPSSVWAWTFCYAVLLLLLAGLALLRSPAVSLCALSGVTAALIMWDTFRGAEAMKGSILGYDPMIGARYYGIGNEYMGVLVGAAVLFVSALLHLLRERVAGKMSVPNRAKAMKAGAMACAVLFAAVTFLFAAPQWGTNAGGTLTASVALGFLWFRMFADKRTIDLAVSKVVTTVVSFVGAAFGGLWLMNRTMGWEKEEQSHIGRALDHVQNGDWDILRQIALRKWEMNWHLIGVSWWGKLLITALFVMCVLLIRPRGVLQKWLRKYPFLMHGFTAGTLGAIVALFTNDSGIIAAATLIVYVAVPMLMLAFYDNEANCSHSE